MAKLLLGRLGFLGLLVLGGSILVAGLDAANQNPRAFRSEPRVGLLPVREGLGEVVQAVNPSGVGRHLYVVKRAGVVLVIDGRVVRRRAFLDLRSRVVKKGLQGLFSIAFHPEYRRYRRVYVNYTGRDGAIHVDEYRTIRTRALPATRRPLLTIPRQSGNPYQHVGGRVAFGPDGLLYVGVGDGGIEGEPGAAQDLSSSFGKLLRLDVADAGQPRAEVVAYGLRSPWRFSFDRKTGDLFLADVGEKSWEEIDFLQRGTSELVNFGWDAFEGRAAIPGRRLDLQGKLVFPVKVYGHRGGNCAVTGGFVYRGKSIPAIRGRYLYGDLCSGRIWSLRVRNGEATDVRRESITVSGLTSFGEDARGELYVTSLNGGVYRIVRR